MTFRVINNPSFDPKTGFTNAQFKKLDGLYLKAASEKTLTYRTVECDFDEGLASYTYYKVEGQTPYLQFIIRKVGPKTMMYEVFKHGKGRIKKSGVFEIAYKKLQEEIENLG
jgi:hypothetical protein